MTKVASCLLPNLEKRFSMNYMRESLIESISSVFACVFVLHVCIWPAVLTCRVLPNQHSTPLTNTLFFSLLPMSRYTELVKHEAEQLTAAVFLTKLTTNLQKHMYMQKHHCSNSSTNHYWYRLILTPARIISFLLINKHLMELKDCHFVDQFQIIAQACNWEDVLDRSKTNDFQLWWPNLRWCGFGMQHGLPVNLYQFRLIKILR